MYFVVDIFTLLLVPFASKLVNHSRHSDSLKYVWKSTNQRKMSSISEFFRMFQESLCLELLANLDAKSAKRCGLQASINSFKNIFFYMDGRLSNFVQLYSGWFILIESVCSIPAQILSFYPIYVLALQIWDNFGKDTQCTIW